MHAFVTPPEWRVKPSIRAAPGVEKTNVHDYNVAEGWVRVEVPTAKDRRGNPMLVKLSGTVEPYFRPAR